VWAVGGPENSLRIIFRRKILYPRPLPLLYKVPQVFSYWPITNRLYLSFPIFFSSFRIPKLQLFFSHSFDFSSPFLSAFCPPLHLLFGTYSVAPPALVSDFFSFSSPISSAFHLLSAFHLPLLLLFISHFFCFSSPTSSVFFSPNF
jgi:hypothetical protein